MDYKEVSMNSFVPLLSCKEFLTLLMMYSRKCNAYEADIAPTVTMWYMEVKGKMSIQFTLQRKSPVQTHNS